MTGDGLRRGTAERILAVLSTGARELVTPPAGTVPGLDFLRSMAILLVMSGHYLGSFVDGLGRDLSIGRLPLFLFSWTGVDLFFVLSGYLIGRQLWRELQRRGNIDVPRFLLRRGLRIWPFYFAFLAVCALVTLRAEFFPDLFFISNYVKGGISGGWSLSTEEQFYICIPLLLLALHKCGLGIRRQVLAIVLLLALEPLVRFVTIRAHGVPLSAADFQRVIQLPFHTHADGLLAGVIIAWVGVCAPAVLAPRPLLRNLLLPLGLAIAGMVLRAVNRELFSFSALAMIFAGSVVFALRDRSALSRFTGLRAFHLLSRLSYGMYLNHFIVLAAAAPLFASLIVARHTYPAFAAGYVLAILASMLVSAITFIVIESPFLQWRDRWLTSTRTVTRPGASHVT